MTLSTVHCNGRIELRGKMFMSGPQSDDTENGIPKDIATIFQNKGIIQQIAVIYSKDGYEGSVIYGRMTDDPNYVEMKNYKKDLLSEKTIRAWFTSAGFDRIEKVFLLKNGYDPEEEEPWFLVKTKIGLIEIGWRSRVISIDWSDTKIRKIVTKDDVTKGEDHVHAWSVAKAIEYLAELRLAVE